MVNHEEAIFALRTKLLTLEVVFTAAVFGDIEWSELGAVSFITMSVSGGKFARATGSFISDGFRLGMEVNPSGFTESENNARGVIMAVTALTMTVNRTLTDETTGTGKTLVVELPATRVWSNSEPVDADGAASTITRGTPYFEEQYLPGPMAQETLGKLAQLEVLPQYIPRIFVPSNTGVAAAMKYTTALLALFAPGTAFTLSVSSSTMRVRRDVAPFSGQLAQASPGFAVVPITVPLRLRTANSI